MEWGKCTLCLAANAGEADTTLCEGDSMNDSNSSEQQTEIGIRAGGSPNRTIQRRTIVKGAAWSLPVFAAAVAVPMASASGTPACATQKTFFTLPDSPSAEGINTSFVVPAKVTLLTVTVAGGAGGTTAGSAAVIRGGNGGLVTATIPVVPGETLGLVVGQGGASRTALTANPLVVTGGQGFGNGGDSDPAGDNPDSGRGTSWGGAAGGAGSAILRGTQPLVVAGGGGGAAGFYGQNFTYHNGGRGGDAGFAGEANWEVNPTGRMDNPGGLVGGGAAGPGTASPPRAFRLLPGLASSSARDGAIGGGISQRYAGQLVTSGAGAGGGGFAGGGSGARGADVAATRAWVVQGAGGAGGTSYLDTASGVVGNTTIWKQNTRTTSRQGGTITIEWCA